jgi:hypothetical protein
METLLGYVFWHWPLPSASTASYEAKLRSFQRALTSDRPTGLVEALSYRMDRLPWEKKRRRGYEDWYLVEDFSSLGVINQAAVANGAAVPHDSIAKWAAGGTGGLYRRIGGELPLPRTRFVVWFQKPEGFTYRSLQRLIDKSVSRYQVDVWQRQMTLGPAPEFCIHSEEKLRFPADFHAIFVGQKMISHG